MYRIWLFPIATDKILVEKQKEIKILQEKLTSLNVHLMEREERIIQLMENMKGKQLLDILLCQIICLVLQSQVVQLRDQIKSYNHRLSQTFEEVLAGQQEPQSDDKLTQEKPDEREDDTSLDHETEDISSQSKI